MNADAPTKIVAKADDVGVLFHHPAGAFVGIAIADPAASLIAGDADPVLNEFASANPAMIPQGDSHLMGATGMGQAATSEVIDKDIQVAVIECLRSTVDFGKASFPAMSGDVGDRTFDHRPGIGTGLSLGCLGRPLSRPRCQTSWRPA